MVELNELNEGWVCPSCKKVFAPSIKMCKKCSKALKNEDKNEDSSQLLEE